MPALVRSLLLGSLCVSTRRAAWGQLRHCHQRVLILGRFTPERKAVLDALGAALRTRDYTPVHFDFEKPANRGLTETVATLAHRSRFIAADLTDPRSIPHELMATVKRLPSVPLQPILQAGSDAYGMFEHLTRYPWVLPIARYDGVDNLIASLNDRVIAPAETRTRASRAEPNRGPRG